ncbi:DUF2868 domain-containing protein [Allopusillimonas soli]|uniref:DUF2868 domain-containing protein n=2 Tax=Allopusillimonas soli TaxID=659016 RepID=A0A853FE45_9BURK|nr:DUF2868 domain-containing protein [Allopusillimonas soli]TEA73831.1 DUF2868 domain-containing protein [Allopusillimonas soli]
MPERNSPTVAVSRMRSHWLAETIRLRESLWGPLEDGSETRRARAAGGTFADRLLYRAQLLGGREKLDTVLDRWTAMARLSLFIMAVAAVIAGGAAALGALGDGNRSVNIVMALATLLGLNLLTFLFWLLSFGVSAGSGAGAWLGECWLWLTRRLARGPDAALAPRALIELLDRERSLRWAMGGISHALWILALGAAVLVMLALLSARRYGFNWETTLLTPDTFVDLTRMLGWLPARLGFPTPTEAIIRASDGLQTLPASAQALWSGWLIGCLVVYGLLPRLAALTISLWMVRMRMGAITLDPTLPGHAELRDRLMPASLPTGVDSAPTDGYQTRITAPQVSGIPPGQALLIGLELPPDTPWPPSALPASVIDMGMIDSGAQRKRLLDSLQDAAPARVLLGCDAGQTPDRGTIALIAEIAGLSGTSGILLCERASGGASASRGEPAPTPMASHAGEASRAGAWRERLVAAGFEPERIHAHADAAVAWLAGTVSPPDDTSGTAAENATPAFPDISAPERTATRARTTPGTGASS